ncbi:hypothetical protein NIES4101_43760 [Calothrix sp. NIES-4101]|nr:hypothetical protein NIES4101_43760 [Calothrix sp. NIES-4101]
MNFKIYAPNVHLFAYHLYQSKNSEELWQKCQVIFDKFHLAPPLQLRKVAPGSRIDLLVNASHNNILLTVTGHLTNPEKKKITGRICPLQIYDSSALALNIRIPELDDNQQLTPEVETSIFRQFNVDECLLPAQINPSLGQTLLLTAWLSPQQQQEPRKWREIANECIQFFLDVDAENIPPLYQSGLLFDSPIYEYGIPQANTASGHIIVWLFLGEKINSKYYSKADENLGFFYQEFIDLFFYRSKVTKTYQINREVHRQIYQGYEEIKQIIREIAPKLPDNQSPQTANNLSVNHLLAEYKQKLRILPKIDLEYSNSLREFNNNLLTIDINNHNYAEKLRQIQDKLPTEDLSFLSLFNQKIATNFQAQITDEQAYFAPGSTLADKAIASIRGIVEIEQAETDRALAKALKDKEETAQKRDKKLQLAIALAGTGLAVSSISADNPGKPVESILKKIYPNQSLDCPNSGINNCLDFSGYYVAFHVGVGVIAALILAIFILLVSKIIKIFEASSRKSS